ncbi:zinc finger protein CO3-like [Diospyros lotus]|uniref:zinc finger protein CO3-like n=1 Tax=Diospyros lotus TaxID=55363 RepID=UPI00225BC148|nr:zinc finger protein CO3-like [Diospyros lotus]
MYGHINHPLMSYGAEDFSGHLPPPTGEDFYSMAAVGAAKSEVGYTSSGCSSYGSPSSLTGSHFSAPSSSSSLMQRSVSSHSLQKNICGFPQLTPASLLADFIDSETCPVRKVFSTGDLQRINVGQHYHRSNSPLSNENSTSIIEGMSRACRYSPEEKKERIERYKSKRSHRNFNKKIQYACRKTLADSRPRIRGRFARNDEIEKSRSGQNQWNQHAGAVEEDDDDIDDNWINLLDLFSANLIP